jgi:hypothetical protein
MRKNLWRFGELSKDAETVLAELLPEGGKPQPADSEGELPP